MEESPEQKQSEQHHNYHIRKSLESISTQLSKRAAGYRKSVFERFPFLFIGLSTFGGVATLYGFEKVIDNTPILADKPFTILGVGVATLLLTGTLFNVLR